ncbi:MAG: peptidase [Flavobacterium sp.]|nr:MAG: peptidase [Flavobacterium sp.]
MKFTLLMALLGLMCCNSSENPKIAPKDYAATNLEAVAYCRQNGLNNDFYFLVDLSVHSGKNRFFVYDFKQKKIVDENLVTHGTCDAFGENPKMFEKAKCSNRVDSHCSASGKYKIGKRDYSAWGIKVKYWLKGLETTNDNSEKRVVVLHSWEAVSDTEVYPDYSPLSWGCPAVSDNFMTKLDTRLKDVRKPVLLWIVE